MKGSFSNLAKALCKCDLSKLHDNSPAVPAYEDCKLKLTSCSSISPRI